MPKVMILEFNVKNGDHLVMVQVSELENGKFRTSVREKNCENKLINDITATFISNYSAVKFAKRYIFEYLDEL